MIDWIKAYCARHHIETIHSFGVSMGGFGAAIVANHLPVTRALMLSPQAAIDQHSAFDHRFRETWNALGETARPTMAPCRNTGTDFTCLFTVDDLFDVLHAAEVRRMIPQVRMIPIHGDHNVGSELRARKEHVALLQWLMGKRKTHGVTTFTGHLSAVFRSARLIDEGRWDAVQQHVDAQVTAVQATSCAGIVFPALDRALFHRMAQQQPTYSETSRHHAYPARSGMTVARSAIKPYRGAGWTDSEFNGYWSLGSRSSIRALLIDRQDQDQPMRLKIRGYLFVAPGRARLLRISQNGKILWKRRISHSHDRPSNMPLSIDVMVTGPLMELMIDTPDPVSPSAIDGSPDNRPLGFWLELLSFRDP